MYLFYQSEIGPGSIVLNPEESKHCIRVMRFRTGDTVHVTDGKGNLYSTILVDEDTKGCHLEIVSITSGYNKRNFILHIAVAIPKNPARFEWFLEKATEAGIDRITPLISEKSEKKNFNHNRAMNIMVSSIKQSNRAYLPQLSKPIEMYDLITMGNEKAKFIASCFGDQRKDLKSVYKPGEDAIILIGPEGDFTDKEFKKTLETGFEPIALGSARLRTETAALVACITINLLNGSL